MRRSYLVPVLISNLFVSLNCNNNNSGGGGGPEDPTVVTFVKPTAGATIINGTNLTIEGNVTDANILTSVRVEVRNKTSGAILYTASVTTSSVTLYSFLWTWLVTGISSNVAATVKVTGKDSRGNEGFKEVDVNLVP